MVHKITIELDNDTFEKLKKHADIENLSPADFILNAAVRYVEQNELVDEFELAQILEDEKLLE